MKLYKIILLSCLATFLASCTSSEKLLRSGEYDAAFYKSWKKLRNNPKKEKQVRVIEEAYRKAQQEDLAEIQLLKKEGQPANWEKIYDRYSSVRKRQQKAKSLPVLYIENEDYRRVKFDYIDIDSDLLEARKNAATYNYTHAIDLLSKGGRDNARKAYYELLDVKKFYTEFRDVDDQIKRALHLGTSQVLIRSSNLSGMVIPVALQDELMRFNTSELNGKWVRFHTRADSTVSYHYLLKINIRKIEVSPEMIKEVHYEETAQVQDGSTPQLDQNGNTVKDSLGNVIMTPVYKTVWCKIIETQQAKFAHMEGSVEFHDNISKQLMKSIPASNDGHFEHSSAIAIGDLRALKPETLAKTKRTPIPFPSNSEMILQSGQLFKELVRKAVYDNRDIFD